MRLSTEDTRSQVNPWKRLFFLSVVGWCLQFLWLGCSRYNTVPSRFVADEHLEATLNGQPWHGTVDLGWGTHTVEVFQDGRHVLTYEFVFFPFKFLVDEALVVCTRSEQTWQITWVDTY